MEYRREIDGLRALAVLPVIFFHAGFKIFGGGYVGVDVFFVISGYLITSILLTELAQDRFSLRDFYERRARRILPALFLVLLCTIPFAWLYLHASHFKSYSQSLLAILAFSSNFLFWHESGYFDADTELKPLLHTWSLAVEEQFYIFFPLLLLIFWRKGQHIIRYVLALLFVSSLVLADFRSYGDPAAAFFLVTSRCWELLLGAFAAFYLTHKNTPIANRPIRECAGILGLALILFAIFNFSKNTPFPGMFALIPTTGALLIILFSSQETYVGKLLGTKIFVGIGLLSYSAYLWHQPLFAFVRSGWSTTPGTMEFGLLCVTVFFLAYLSWRFVELPFRNKEKLKFAKVLKLTLLFGLIIASVGLTGHSGVAGHSGDSIPKLSNAVKVNQTKLISTNFVVVGDSHGSHLISGLNSITSGKVMDLTSGGCIPLRNVDNYDSRFAPGSCAKKVTQWLDQILKENPEAVILLSSMGPVYLDNEAFKGKSIARITGSGVELVTDKSLKDRYKVFEIGLRQTLQELSSLSKSTIVFALDIPELGIDLGCNITPKEIRLGNFILHDALPRVDGHNCFVSRTEYDKRNRAYRNLVIKVLADFPKILLFDPESAFCNEQKCKGYDARYGYLYRDVDHLNHNGSRFYAEALLDFLKVKQPNQH